MPKELAGSFWTLLRPLFPSWRFFEETDWTPKLQYRIVDHGEDAAWRDALPPEQRALSTLFINARGNLRLATQSLVERLVSDLSELELGDSADSLVSYELVTRFVASRIPEDVKSTQNARFQFRVIAVSFDPSPSEEILLSAPHEVPAHL